MLHPDPYPSREAWCQARIDATTPRLAALDPALPTILVNHFPLTRDPTRILRYPVFAQWCGTEQTADWHLRYRALAVVYGHLHIPRTTWQDGVRFEEVSLGYPQEQDKYPSRPRRLTQILPFEPASTVPTRRGVMCTRCRGGSSAGQSSGLIIRRSWVRAPPAPPAVLPIWIFGSVDRFVDRCRWFDVPLCHG